MTPLKAIRLNCLECCVGSAKEVRLCQIPDCPLFQYRLGHNPKLKGKGNIANFGGKKNEQKFEGIAEQV